MLGSLATPLASSPVTAVAATIRSTAPLPNTRTKDSRLWAGNRGDTAITAMYIPFPSVLNKTASPRAGRQKMGPIRGGDVNNEARSANVPGGQGDEGGKWAARTPSRQACTVPDAGKPGGTVARRIHVRAQLRSASRIFAHLEAEDSADVV